MTSSPPVESPMPWVVRLGALPRLAIAVIVGGAVWATLRIWFSGQLSVLASWDVGVLCLLVLDWLLVARSDEQLTRLRAQRYDPNRYVIFLLVISAASASFVAIGFIVGDIRELTFWPRVGRISLSVAALLLSWLLIHTLFAFHYARLYYFQPAEQKAHLRGLRFPDDDEPDYLDFAYYSFVVGMTSQVSDVAVLSRQMRRLTIIHGVLSFIYNIAILAMSINIIGNVL